MKLTITKIAENQYTYQEENKDVLTLDEKSIVLEKKTGIYWLKLPENPLNRKLLSLKKFSDTDVVTLDTYKTSVSIGSTPKKSLEEYMTDEEKKIIAEIKERAEKRREEDKKKAEEKKNDPIEKAKKKVNSIIENLKALGMSEEAIAKLINQK